MNSTGIKKLILSKKDFKPEENIIICSETRGGSTWLMQIMNEVNKTVNYWEPLHVDNGVVPKHFKFGWRPYIQEDDKNHNYKELFQSILSGKLQNVWTLQYSGLLSVFRSEKLIIKSVRANLLLPYLVKNFNFKHKPIFLLRHPVAVAQSQINSFYKKDPFKVFEIPDVINNERYQVHIDFMKSLKTKLEQRVALWCLHNIDTIKHPLNNKAWITVFYEEMLMYPYIIFSHIFKELNLEVSDAILHDLRKASKSDYKKSYLNDQSEQLKKWQNNLNPDETKKLQEIFDYFDFSIYSCSDVMPNQEFSTSLRVMNEGF